MAVARLGAEWLALPQYLGSFMLLALQLQIHPFYSHCSIPERDRIIGPITRLVDSEHRIIKYDLFFEEVSRNTFIKHKELFLLRYHNNNDWFCGGLNYSSLPEELLG
jgi:hypothetical protein